MAGRPSVRLVTSAGAGEGRGHVSRTVTLAEAIRGAGASVRVELLRGELSDRDRDRLRAIAADMRPPDSVVDDAVLVDLPDPNEIAGRWPASRLAIFDDSNLLTSSAAVVVQPSLARWGGSTVANRVLEGYAFAPIRSTLRRLAAQRLAEAVPPQVVVCFGGSDPWDLSARIAPAVASAGSWSTVAVLGTGYQGRLRETGDEGGAGLRMLRDPPDLDRRLATATVALIGAGTMKFELAVLGRPAILVAAAEDQLPIAAPFAATGAARYLGDGRELDPAAIGEAVAALMADEPARIVMASRARAAVDGQGADRIAAAVLELARAQA